MVSLVEERISRWVRRLVISSVCRCAYSFTLPLGLGGRQRYMSVVFPKLLSYCFTSGINGYANEIVYFLLDSVYSCDSILDS